MDSESKESFHTTIYQAFTTPKGTAGVDAGWCSFFW